MRLTYRSALRVAALAALSVVLLAAAPAGAVVGGVADTANKYSNVAVLQLRFQGEWFQLCSGTLVKPNVVLTAAHCTDFLVEVGPDGFGPADLRISFDPTPGAASKYYATDHIVVHPDWLLGAPGRGNSKQLYLAPPHEDVSLIWLAEPVAGVTPAPVADLGYLDGLNLKRETFTAVGYGSDGFQTGSGAADHPIVLDDGTRSYRNVSAIPATDAFPDRFVKIGKSVCFGDSGGPLFHGKTVVALNTWTFSYRCDGPNLEYRVDSAPAQRFLDRYL